MAVSFAVTLWWSLWPFDGHVRAKLALLSKTERRPLRQRVGARSKYLRLCPDKNGEGQLLLALRRHLALDHSDTSVFVVARTERLVGVYSRSA